MGRAIPTSIFFAFLLKFYIFFKNISDAKQVVREI